ncbi:MAG: helix-turn-helix transcriptional regulator [Clostridiaceae bacterium]|nr:helix-turn-helix transcriptional regulator [Clostridiaceae bacterium]
MNENKTGVFISTLRKEKELTQAQLAEKLNVTDKAISRWETGKGMPDSSLLVPLANILGITVNELLTGEKISEETFSKKSEDNLVVAVQRTETAVKKGKTVKLFLIIAVIICVFSISFLIKTVIDKQNTVTYVGDFRTKNRISVTELLIDLDSRNSYFSENTVCTDIDIRLDENGNFKRAEIKMNDESMHEYINLALLSQSEQPEQLSYIITKKYSYYSTEDGILYSDLCDFLKNEEFIESDKDYSEIENFDEFYITGMSTLYFNFEGNGNTGFATQHLFADGEFKKVDNDYGMNGKYYEIGVGTMDTLTGADCTCFGVYIER